MHALGGQLILDLSRRYPGSYTSMFLGDFGARVIKVDPPGLVTPSPDVDTATERFAAFYAPDRNKESIVVNLKSEEGRRAFVRLSDKADVLIEGFRPGVMSRMGVGYERLKETNPRLIYCALTGFGQDGPYVDLPGHDMNYIALGGALSMIGNKGDAPCLPSNYLADMAGAGLHGVIGVLLALAAREKTGRGQFVDISYLDGVISLLAIDASFYFVTGNVPRRGETMLTGNLPFAQVVKCKNGEYLSIGCIEPHFWERLCKAIGREDLIPHQFPAADKKDWVLAELRRVFLSKTRDEWWQVLKDKDTCVAPVYYFNETFSDPQVRHRQMVLELEHPRVGKVEQTGIPIKLSDTPGEVRTLGTVAGFDTFQVLEWIGYSKQEIAQLHESGAVA